MQKVRLTCARFLVTLAFLATLAACKDEPTAEEQFLATINRKWTASSAGVTLDGVAVNGVFKGFSITLTDEKTYMTTAGNAPIWAAAGKYELAPAAGPAGFNLVREDGVIITVERPTDQRLVLSFQYVSKGSRTSSVSGRYVFDLESL